MHLFRAIGAPGSGPYRVSTVALVCLVALAGCADKYSGSRAKLRPWLNQQPRVLAVALDTKPPEPRVGERDSRVFSAVLGFLGGAVAGAIAPWTGGGGAGDPKVAIAISAVFAVGSGTYFAVTQAMDPPISWRPAAKSPALEPILRFGIAERHFERSIQAKVVQFGGARTGNRLQFRDEPFDRNAEPPPDVDGVIVIDVRHIDLIREHGDARYALAVSGDTLVFPAIGRETAARRRGKSRAAHSGYSRWEYEGKPRTPAEWQANGGAAFLAEMDRAAQTLAENIVAKLWPAASKAQLGASADAEPGASMAR